MNKKLIRLTEGDLHRIVREEIANYLFENSDYKQGEIWKRFRGNGIGEYVGDRNEYEKYVRKQRKIAKSKGKTPDISIYFQPLKVLHNEWLVHFCPLEQAKNIVKNGFKGCALSKTPYSSGNHSNRVGFNYAFLLSEVDGNDGEFDVSRFYTSSGVIFKANGILGYHYGDKNRQVIFHGRDVRNALYFDNNKLINKDGKIIFKGNRHYFGDNNEYFHYGGSACETLHDIYEWLQNNEHQYRNLIG